MLLDSVSSITIIVTSVIIVVALIGFLAFCLCKVTGERPNDYGTEGQVIFTNENADVLKNGDVKIDVAEAKSRSATVNRRLPEIPFDGGNPSQGVEASISSQASNSSLQLYEVVLPEKSEKKSAATTSNIAGASVTRSQSVKQRANKSSELSSTIVAESSGANKNTPVGHPYAIVKIQLNDHAYDKIQNQATETSGESADNYSSPHIYAQSTNVNRPGSTKQRPFSWEDSTVYEYPPPVPEKQFKEDRARNVDDSEENDERGDDSSESGAIAAEPVAAQRPNNIPPDYPQEDTPSEGPYTSISVREPIANLRAAERLRQRERATHVYTTVNDDELDQTYAEIESASRNNDSESVMYDLVAPSAETSASLTQAASVETPPAPPTVESLMSVTQAHSRQASDASSASHSILNSPELTREQAIPTPDDHTSTNSHITSSQNASSAATSPANINLDELYAKVVKNKSSDLRGTRSKVPQNNSLLTNRRVQSVVYGANDGPTMSVPQRSSTAFESSSFVNFGLDENSKFGDGGCEDVDRVNLPGYESLKRVYSDSSEPGYESLKQAGSEPGYETIRQQYCNDAANDSSSELGFYETLNIGGDDAVDPCYQTLSKNKSGNEERAVYGDDFEPPYEGIRESDDPGYEGIRDVNSPYAGTSRVDDKSPYEGIELCIKEPPYEGIQHSDPPYEGICSPVNEPPYEGFEDDPPYEGIKRIDPPYVTINPPPLDQISDNDSKMSESSSRENSEYDSDPLYEGIDNRGTYRQDSATPEFVATETMRHSDSDSAKSDGWRDAFDDDGTDSSEPGYETVRNALNEEPAYETLKPRNKDDGRNSSDLSAEATSSSDSAVDNLESNKIAKEGEDKVWRF